MHTHAPAHTSVPQGHTQLHTVTFTCHLGTHLPEVTGVPEGNKRVAPKPGLSQSLFPPYPLTFLYIPVHSILMCLPRCIQGLYHPALTKLQGSHVTYKIPAKKLQPILLSQREVAG